MEGIVGILGTADVTNEWLAEAWRDRGLTAVAVRPEDADRLGPGDVLIGRLDILPTLDGVEPGLASLLAAEARGVRVLNTARSLLRTHDKLLTAALLRRYELPHPRTEHVHAGERPTLRPPVVVKPRYGSWGRDVVLCRTRGELASHLGALEDRGWFLRHGALVQELMLLPTFDLRIVVAGGQVVGAAERVSAPGEWRTNMSLGARLRRPRLRPEACDLALAAAAASGCDLVGADLLPTPDGWVVLELNGTVDFDRRYSLLRSDVYAEAAVSLALPVPERAAGAVRAPA
jgi:RimK family alpha-L-glutamate ligase